MACSGLPWNPWPYAIGMEDLPLTSLRVVFDFYTFYFEKDDLGAGCYEGDRVG